VGLEVEAGVFSTSEAGVALSARHPPITEMTASATIAAPAGVRPVNSVHLVATLEFM
jgi:hypothetical protein